MASTPQAVALATSAALEQLRLDLQVISVVITGSRTNVASGDHGQMIKAAFAETDAHLTTAKTALDALTQ